jgi:hypothetical protein
MVEVSIIDGVDVSWFGVMAGRLIATSVSPSALTSESER